MSYTTFSHLLQVKLSLLKALHTAAPAEHLSLRRSIDELDRLLGGCEAYDAFIRRYATTATRIW